VPAEVEKPAGAYVFRRGPPVYSGCSNCSFAASSSPSPADFLLALFHATEVGMLAPASIGRRQPEPSFTVSEFNVLILSEGIGMKHIWIALGLCLAAATGCGGKQAEIKEDRLTVGRVQGEVKMGMSAAQVAELLGSPNIVTTDDKRREVWIYDKVSTDRVDTSSSAFGTLIILGANSRDSSSSQRQRTLTIIIKYDEEKRVRDFAYNATQF